MFVPKRKPAAHLVAAVQSSFKGCHIYLESGADCRFWGFFMNNTDIMLHACNGWPNVIETVKLESGKSVLSLGIIDNDFRALFNYPDVLPDNVYTTDEHDIEMMAARTDAAKHVISQFDSSGKVKDFEQKEGDIMSFVYGITDSIGLVKLANLKHQIGMVFRFEKDETFELPKYEKFLDRDCHYLSDEKMIEYLCQWSESHGHRPNKEQIEIKDLIEIEKEKDYDTMQLSCGHDVCYVLSLIIKKRISNKGNISQEEMERLLAVAYSSEHLKRTTLYTNIVAWGNANGVKVFND